MESLEAPVTTTSGAEFSPYAPRKESRSVSKPVDRSVDRIERVVIAALAVFRLVVNCGTVNLYLTGGKITLEVRHVIHGVPEAEFHVGENGERLSARLPLLVSVSLLISQLSSTGTKAVSSAERSFLELRKVEYPMP